MSWLFKYKISNIYLKDSTQIPKIKTVGWRLEALLSRNEESIVFHWSNWVDEVKLVHLNKEKENKNINNVIKWHRN